MKLIRTNHFTILTLSGDLHVTQHKPFTVDEFAVTVGEAYLPTYGNPRKAQADFKMTANEAIQKELATIKEQMKDGRHNLWNERAIENHGTSGALTEDFHYKGCRNDAQKKKRAKDALAKLKERLKKEQFAKVSSMLTRYQEELHKTLGRFRQDYERTLVKVFTGENLSAEWQKENLPCPEVLEKEIEDLWEQLKAIRERRNAARDRKRVFLNAAMLAYLDAHGWSVDRSETDESCADTEPFPEEPAKQIREKLEANEGFRSDSERMPHFD